MFSNNSLSETFKSHEKKNQIYYKSYTNRMKFTNSFESPVNISSEIPRITKINIDSNDFHTNEDNSEFSEENFVNFWTPSNLDCKIDEVCFRNILNFQKEFHSASNKGNSESFGDKLVNKDGEHEKKKLIFEKTQYKNENERRKYSIDSIHKKIKRLFFDFLENKIKTMHDMCNAPKIPHNTISNVTIKYNKKILSYTISEFYLHFCNYNFTLKSKENGSKISNELYKLLNIKIKDYFIMYFKEQFEKDLGLLAQKETVYYCNKLKQRASIFVEYYTKLKPYQKKLKSV